METKIDQISPSTFAFTINVPAEEMEKDIDKMLRVQRKRTPMKGFRPGMVPLSMLRKMIGDEVGETVANDKVQEAYNKEVVESGKYTLLASPEIKEFDYTLGSDFSARVEFYVRPEFELADLSGETFPRYDDEITDEDVEESIQRQRRKLADLVPTEEPVGEDSYVQLDVVPLDEETGEPLEEQIDRDVSFFMDLEGMSPVLKDAVRGKRPGDTAVAEFVHEGEHHLDGEEDVEDFYDEAFFEDIDESEDDAESEQPAEAAEEEEVADSRHEAHEDEGEGAGHSHVHRYELRLTEVKVRELRDIDEEFIMEVTEGAETTDEGLRSFMKAQYEEAVRGLRYKSLLEQFRERLTQLHPIEVAQPILKIYEDAMRKEAKEEGRPLASQTEEAFDQDIREKAEDAARWYLIYTALIDKYDLSVSEDEIATHLLGIIGGQENPDAIRQVVKRYPGYVDSIRNKIMDEKVVDLLSGQVQFVDPEPKAVEEDEAEAE